MAHLHLSAALRSLRRDARYTAANVAGLAVALAVALVLLAWLWGQAQQDAWHERAADTYRVTSTVTRGARPDPVLYASAPPTLPALLRAEPEVAGVAEIVGGFALAPDASGAVPAAGVYADGALFEVFSFRLDRGDARTALAEPGRVVLSAATARRLFGDAEALGRTVETAGGAPATVTGILAPHAPTHLPLDAVASLSTLPPAGADWDSERGGRSTYTFVTLAPGAEPTALAGRLAALRSAFPDRPDAHLDGLTLQPLGRVNLSMDLYDDPLGTVLPGHVALVLGGLVGVLLLVACVNYAGLAVARGLRASREAGVRRVLGASRASLAARSLVEAGLVVGASALAAVVLAALLTPAFNGLSVVRMTDSSLSAASYLAPGLALPVLALIAGVVGAAGLYPALRLSRVRPAEAVRARAEGGARGGLWLRRGLVVAQFVASLVLVATTWTLARQARLLLAADYGFETADLLAVPSGDAGERLAAWAATQPDIVNVARTSTPPGYDGRSDAWLRVTTDGDAVEGAAFAVGDGFFDVLGLRLVAGTAPTATGAVLNERAVRALGLGAPADAIGARVRVDSAWVDVVGVVQDYQARTAALGAQALVLRADPAALRWTLVRVRPGASERVAAALAAAPLGTERPVEAERYAETVAETGDKRLLSELARVVAFVAALTLGVAVLGLLALVAYAVQRRRREVGIRKILGAGTAHILRLLSAEVAALLGVAAAVALPAAVLLNEAWLSVFGLRVSVGPGTLAGTLAAVLAVAALAVGPLVWRADRADPVRALRSE